MAALKAMLFHLPRAAAEGAFIAAMALVLAGCSKKEAPVSLPAIVPAGAYGRYLLSTEPKIEVDFDVYDEGISLTIYENEHFRMSQLRKAKPIGQAMLYFRGAREWYYLSEQGDLRRLDFTGIALLDQGTVQADVVKAEIQKAVVAKPETPPVKIYRP